jgi:hypothetical protein
MYGLVSISLTSASRPVSQMQLLTFSMSNYNFLNTKINGVVKSAWFEIEGPILCVIRL